MQLGVHDSDINHYTAVFFFIVSRYINGRPVIRQLELLVGVNYHFDMYIFGLHLFVTLEAFLDLVTGS